jgi:hypothetical protein
MIKTIISDLYCTACGSRGIPIPRKKGAEREGGHLKKLFCLKCQKEVNHVECKGSYTYNDFLFEFENHNFDENGNRIRTYGQLKELVYNDKK